MKVVQILLLYAQKDHFLISDMSIQYYTEYLQHF